MSIDILKPAAENLLGSPIDIVPPTMVDIFSSLGGHGIYRDEGIRYAARIDGKELRISQGFCRANAGLRLAIVAHELGHLLDEAEGTTPDHGGPDWLADPREISATRHGGEILSAAGIGIFSLVAALPTEHLERAGILHRVALPAIVQKVAGTRKITLFQFEGKPGQWISTRNASLELSYSPTHSVVDDFFLVYFVMQQNDDSPHHDQSVAVEAVAKAYQGAGGDLAAVAAALAQGTGFGDAPPDPAIVRAIRRVMVASPAS